VSFAIVDQGNNLFVVESPDGGISWDSTMVWNATGYEGWGGEENIRPSQYCDALYDVDGNLHVVYDAQYFLDSTQVDSRHPWAGNGTDYFLADKQPRIMHFNSADSSVSTVSVSPYPTANLGATYRNITARSCGSMAYNPKIGLDKATGNLYCVWTQFNENDGYMTSSGSFRGYPDVYMTVSDNNGASWMKPQNVTKTQGFEERDADLAMNVVNGKADILYFGNDGVSSKYGVYHLKVNGNIVTSIEDEVAVAETMELGQNYPNPFNPSTNIEFKIVKTNKVRLDIYNILGQKVKTLVNTNMNQGTYKVMWDGTNQHGGMVSSGVYIYKLQTSDGVKVKKMVFQK